MKRVKGMLYTLIVFPFVLVLGCTALLMVPVLSPLSKMTPAYAQSNGLALTPPMGFNDWNAFACNVTEAKIKQAGPGHWNDPDMLEIGNGTLTQAEQQTHLSLWAEMAAPLLIGTNMLTASQQTLNILKQQAVLTVDQDSLGVQGHVVATSDGGLLQVLTKKLSNGDVAVVLLNADASTKTITTSASVVGLPPASSYTLENLWTGTRTTTTGAISASVPVHGVVMFRVHH